MSDRRTELADAAVSIVAGRGLKALTHRAVDAAAGAPIGTTSNYWRTRESLFDAVITRLEERDRALLSARGGELPTTPEAFARAFAGTLIALTVEEGELTRARLALALARPDGLAEGHRRMMAATAHLLGAAGVEPSDARVRRLADYADGLMLHALTARRDETLDLDDITAAVLALVSF